MFYSTAFSDWNSVTLQARPHRPLTPTRLLTRVELGAGWQLQDREGDRLHDRQPLLRVDESRERTSASRRKKNSR
jgi:hypothetical protein